MHGFTQYTPTRIIFGKETQKQATEITQLSQQTTRLQSDIMQNCRELVIAGRKASELLPEWKEKRDKAGNDIQIQEKLKAELQNESRQRCEKIQEELTIVSNDLKKAVLKEKEYEEHHIKEVMERSAKEMEWKNKRLRFAGRTTHIDFAIHGNLF